ncbi:hypothetical protein Tco_0078237 [Tanacetum coccineum]
MMILMTWHRLITVNLSYWTTKFNDVKFDLERRVSGEVKKWRHARSDRGFTFLKYNCAAIDMHRTKSVGKLSVVCDCDDDAISQSLISWGCIKDFWMANMNTNNCHLWDSHCFKFNRSYEHDNGFVFADISIGDDIQMYAGISSCGENLWRVVCADISMYSDISSWAL